MNEHGSNDLVRFEWTVRALAQPAAIQLTLFPKFVCVADELALDFDERLRALSRRPEFAALSPSATELAQKLDRTLAHMSGPEHEQLWTDAALGSDSRWEEVRQQAQALISCMGWSAGPPPHNRAIYVGPDV